MGERWSSDAGSTRNTGVVSQQSLRIALAHAMLSSIETIAADICNAYIQAPRLEKDSIICRAEFGLENVGKVALVCRALYDEKVAGRDF